ncbi:hypothetical protein CF394_03595, partial [Tetzosporium hominis]
DEIRQAGNIILFIDELHTLIGATKEPITEIGGKPSKLMPAARLSQETRQLNARHLFYGLSMLDK